MKTNKVFEHSNDLHVRAVYVYVKTAKAYVDEACTVQFKNAELEDAFLKGAVIVDTNVMYKPVSYTAGKISYVTGTTTPAIASAAGIAE